MLFLWDYNVHFDKPESVEPTIMNFYIVVCIDTTNWLKHIAEAVKYQRLFFKFQMSLMLLFCGSNTKDKFLFLNVEVATKPRK